MLHVLDLGAVGDGVHDDTAALQDAIDRAAARRETVWLPAGTYRCGPLRLRPGVALAGEAGWSYRAVGGAVLRPRESVQPCLIDLSGARGARLEGLALEGPGWREGGAMAGILHANGVQGVPHRNEDDLRIAHCRVTGFPGCGVRLEKVWVFHIRGCLLDHNGGDGLRVEGCDGVLAETAFTGNDGAGFRGGGWTRSMLLNACRSEWNRGGGLIVAGGASYQVGNCFFDRNTGPGIAFVADPAATPAVCEYVTVTGCLLRRNGAHGAARLADDNDDAQARFDGVRGLSVTGNVLVAAVDDGDEGAMAPAYGLVLHNLQQAVIHGNTLANGATRALVRDLGGDGAAVVLRDNPGGLAAGRVRV